VGQLLLHVRRGGVPDASTPLKPHLVQQSLRAAAPLWRVIVPHLNTREAQATLELSQHLEKEHSANSMAQHSTAKQTNKSVSTGQHEKAANVQPEDRQPNDDS
jgi:hypothetical protein